MSVKKDVISRLWPQREQKSTINLKSITATASQLEAKLQDAIHELNLPKLDLAKVLNISQDIDKLVQQGSNDPTLGQILDAIQDNLAKIKTTHLTELKNALRYDAHIAQAQADLQEKMNKLLDTLEGDPNKNPEFLDYKQQETQLQVVRSQQDKQVQAWKQDLLDRYKAFEGEVAERLADLGST